MWLLCSCLWIYLREQQLQDIHPFNFQRFHFQRPRRQNGSLKNCSALQYIHTYTNQVSIRYSVKVNLPGTDARKSSLFSLVNDDIGVQIFVASQPLLPATDQQIPNVLKRPGSLSRNYHVSLAQGSQSPYFGNPLRPGYCRAKWQTTQKSLPSHAHMCSMSLVHYNPSRSDICVTYHFFLQCPGFGGPTTQSTRNWTYSL